MQSMLDTCVNFGLNNDITFNPKKLGFYITNVHSVINLKLGQNDLCKFEELSDLGLKLLLDNKFFTVNVNDRIRKFQKASISIILNSRLIPDNVRCNLIVTKCLLVLLYGLP